MAKNTICLWYEHDAEEAARFYADTFRKAASAPSTGRRPTIATAKCAMS
jgi:2-polyprenyl-6-hydroxyphenyl methylase/3-demethylubiquinone-9 3-methyltransferase